MLNGSIYRAELKRHLAIARCDWTKSCAPLPRAARRGAWNEGPAGGGMNMDDCGATGHAATWRCKFRRFREKIRGNSRAPAENLETYRFTDCNEGRVVHPPQYRVFDNTSSPTMQHASRKPIIAGDSIGPCDTRHGLVVPRWRFQAQLEWAAPAHRGWPV